MNIPKGWKLVPVEPTEEMLAATSWPKCARSDYQHMLSAAPTPPAQQDDEALAVLRELVEARDALVNGETVEQLYAGSRRWRSAASAARALLEKRGEK